MPSRVQEHGRPHQGLRARRRWHGRSAASASPARPTPRQAGDLPGEPRQPQRASRPLASRARPRSQASTPRLVSRAARQTGGWNSSSEIGAQRVEPLSRRATGGSATMPSSKAAASRVARQAPAAATQAAKAAPPRRGTGRDTGPSGQPRAATARSASACVSGTRRRRARRADREHDRAADRVPVLRDDAPAQHMGAAAKPGGGVDHQRPVLQHVAIERSRAAPSGPISRQHQRRHRLAEAQRHLRTGRTPARCRRPGARRQRRMRASACRRRGERARPSESRSGRARGED